MPQVQRNGRHIQALQLSYRPHDGATVGWDFTMRIPRDEAQKYLKLWRRRRASLDLLQFTLGRQRYEGHGKITHVALIKHRDGSTKATEVTWSGLGTPEISATT